MTLNELKKYIDNFVHLSTDEWIIFSGLFTELHLPKDSFFAKEGQIETKVGFLTDGIVRAFYRSNDGTEYNKTFFEPFEFIGAYASLTTGQQNQINIQALTDVRLFVADYSNIVALYDKHPKFERIARIIAEHYFTVKEKREIELVLLDASQRYVLFKKEYPTLENKISQYHIASYLGVTPTQLSRIRAKK
jgi:CRP-like cAMP-binding protein